MGICAKVCFDDEFISSLLEAAGVSATLENIEVVSANAKHQIQFVMQEAGEDMLEAMIEYLKRDSKFDNSDTGTRYAGEDYISRKEAKFEGYATYIGAHEGTHIIVCRESYGDHLFFLPLSWEDSPVVGTASVLIDPRFHNMIGYRYYFEHGYVDYENCSGVLGFDRYYERAELLAMYAAGAREVR